MLEKLPVAHTTHLKLITILTLVTVFVISVFVFIDYYELNQRQRLVRGTVFFPIAPLFPSRIATSFFSLFLFQLITVMEKALVTFVTES